MKNKIKLLPFFALSIISTFAIPLTGCNIGQNPYITDEDYQPDIEQLESDECFHKQEATEKYFTEIMENPTILHEDYAYTFIHNTFTNRKNQLLSEGVTQLESSVKTRTNNVKIEEREFNGVKHYLLSGEFEDEMVFTYHKDLQQQYHIYTETSIAHMTYKTMDFFMYNGGPSWIVCCNQHPSSIGDQDYYWESTFDTFESVRDKAINRQTGELDYDQTNSSHEISNKTSEKDTMPCVLLFSSYHFNQITPYQTVSVETNHPAGVDDPIVSNAENLPRGKDFNTDIILDGLNEGTWEIAGIDMYDGEFKVSKDDWTFEIKDGVGKLHIDGLDKDGKPTIYYDPTIHMTYNKNK